MILRNKKSRRGSTKLQLESLETRRVMDAAGVGALDWGDAPDNGVQAYETLFATNGAHHIVDPVHYLGAIVDPELDGQPNANATGDDIAGAPDEDGVFFLTPLVPGQNAQAEVIASFDGHLSAWVDFNADGKWDPATEQIVASQFLPGGPNIINFMVPPNASPGQTFSRWRFTESPEPLLPGGAGTASGQVLPGEVEDHEVHIHEPTGDLQRDWGDAPDTPGGASYNTLWVNGGAYHVIDNVHFLGNEIDPELDGQPSPNADRDDVAGLAVDDEDGITFLTPLVPGQIADVEVTANDDGFLSAWADFDKSGTWDHPAEQIFNVQFVPAGTHVFSFMVPAGAQIGETFSRWRFTDAQVPLVPWGTGSPNGNELVGEVEDY
ncbi:MAG: GEVED domain-containing protein, partial [Planctomycetota bacterium]